MQKAAPTPGRLLTMVLFALSCFALLLFLWLSFGGPTPLKPKGYRIQAAFPEATQLGLEADVRVAGVTVGKVRKKEIGDEGNRTLATLEIDSRFAPVARDAKAILRQKTLLGETYVELTPGTPGSPRIPEGGRLAESRIDSTVELDEIFQALDKTTQQAFRTWQQELAKSVEGRGRDLNDALGNLPEFAADATDVLAVLDSQDEAVRRLIRNTGSVFGALTEDEAALRGLIVNAGGVFDATSAQQDALAETFKIFPTFLDESKATFAKLETFSRDTDPLIQDLRPAMRDLGPTLRDVRALSPDLETFFRNLDPLIDVSVKGLPALRDILSEAKPLLGNLQPFLEELNPILEWLEYHQTTVSDFFSNGAGAIADTVQTRTEEERGHYLRQWGPTGQETLAMWASRIASNRGNTYPLPTGGSGHDHAKYKIDASFDCKNTGQPTPYLTQLPDSDADPSCYEMPPPAYPPGNTRKYPHIERADYAKPAK
jgi:phospholipid/cholesterol/gamma-HCH transport system substrate-binding protein